jgi:hypothetical protein
MRDLRTSNIVISFQLIGLFFVQSEDRCIAAKLPMQILHSYNSIN